MVIHRIFGCFLAVFYISIFTGVLPWFSGFQSAKGDIDHSLALSMKADQGFSYVYFFAALSIYFLVFPTRAKMRFSPRYGSMGSYSLTEGVWIIAGYLTMVSTFIIMYAFG